MHAYSVLGPLEEKITYLSSMTLVIMIEDLKKNSFLSKLLSQYFRC